MNGSLYGNIVFWSFLPTEWQQKIAQVFESRYIKTEVVEFYKKALLSFLDFKVQMRKVRNISIK